MPYDTKDVTIRLTPRREWRDTGDTLHAAASTIARERGLRGWDLSPRWEDDSSREDILLDLPAWAVTSDDLTP